VTSTNPQEAFIGAIPYYSDDQDSLVFVTDKMNEFGSGSRAQVILAFRKERGEFARHTLIVHNNGGRLRFVDPTGGREKAEIEISGAIDRYTEIIRIDNVEYSDVGKMAYERMGRDRSTTGYRDSKEQGSIS